VDASLRGHCLLHVTVPPFPVPDIVCCRTYRAARRVRGTGHQATLPQHALPLPACVYRSTARACASGRRRLLRAAPWRTRRLAPPCPYLHITAHAWPAGRFRFPGPVATDFTRTTIPGPTPATTPIHTAYLLLFLGLFLPTVPPPCHLLLSTVPSARLLNDVAFVAYTRIFARYPRFFATDVAAHYLPSRLPARRVRYSTSLNAGFARLRRTRLFRLGHFAWLRFFCIYTHYLPPYTYFTISTGLLHTHASFSCLPYCCSLLQPTNFDVCWFMPLRHTPTDLCYPGSHFTVAFV